MHRRKPKLNILLIYFYRLLNFTFFFVVDTRVVSTYAIVERHFLAFYLLYLFVNITQDGLFDEYERVPFQFRIVQLIGKSPGNTYQRTTTVLLPKLFYIDRHIPGWWGWCIDYICFGQRFRFREAINQAARNNANYYTSDYHN